jgi:hypothetical protein
MENLARSPAVVRDASRRVAARTGRSFTPGSVTFVCPVVKRTIGSCRCRGGFGTVAFADRYSWMTKTGMHVAIAAAALLAAICSASAQTETQGCTKQERNNQPLGQKLGQSGGVICPPDIDPAMKAPTPDAGKTPVIPPPGSPGGNPNVQPK